MITAKLVSQVGILFVLISALSSTAFSGTETGNGGVGTMFMGKLTLLDFVEQGIENPKIEQMAPVKDIKKLLDLGNIPPEIPRELLEQKLSEIYEHGDHGLALALANILTIYRVKFVKYELQHTEDEHTTVKGDLFQIAVRLGSSYFINKELWDRLDNVNKIGLLMHEFIFTIIKPEKAFNKELQRSERVREINAYFFGENWYKNKRDYTRLTDGLPQFEHAHLEKGSDLIFVHSFPNDSEVHLNLYRGGVDYLFNKIDFSQTSSREELESVCESFSYSNNGVSTLIIRKVQSVTYLNMAYSSYEVERNRMNYIQWGSSASENAEEEKNLSIKISNENCVSTLRSLQKRVELFKFKN